MKKNILLILSLFLLIVSCQTLSLSEDQTEVNVSKDGGFHVFSFESSRSWTATSSESWCSVNPSSGNSRTKSITVSIATNETYFPRSSTITIKSGGKSESLIINQSANSGLLVTQNKYDLNNDANTIEVEVKANVEYYVYVSDDWITQVVTRSLSSNKIKFNIAENKSYSKRDGTITIRQKDGELTSTIKVYQSQNDAIIISRNTENLSNDSQTLEVELKTNVDFEVIIPDGAKNWVSYTGTRALRTETLLLNIAKNAGYTGRTTDIYVKNKKTNLQDTLTINQNNNSGLIVSKDKYELNNEAATIEVEIKSNVDFDVIISDNWITRVTTRALTSTILSFDIAKNGSYDNRNGSILIREKNGALSSTIDIYQSQKDAIILSKKTEDLSNDSHALSVELKTNVNFEVIIPEDAKSWVTYTPTRGLRDETVLLNIAKNEGFTARTTHIYIKDKETSLQDTLTINQSANSGIEITQDKYDLRSEGDNIEVEVKTNLEFDVTTSHDWISQITTRNLTSNILNFSIAKNETPEKREGTITIKQRNGVLSKTIEINQSQQDEIILSEKIAELSKENQTLEVELKTNVDFNVIIPDEAKSWISYTPTRSLRNEKLIFNISENDGDDIRSAKIQIENEERGVKDILTINQAN